MAVLLAVAWLPPFRVADAPPSDTPSGDRDRNLDGLRGFLALAVFFHHAVISQVFLRTGIWQVPPSAFYTLLGRGGVSIFFLITAYLFWGKCLRSNGKIRIADFYIGRVFRIGPLYVMVIACMLGVVAVRTWGSGSPGQFAKDSLKWLPLGITFGHDVNGYKQTSLIIAAVTWSLVWEWRYYLALPVLSYLLIRLPRGGAPLACVTVGMIGLSAALQIPVHIRLLGRNIHRPPSDPEWLALYLLFALGMCCAALRHQSGRVNWPERWNSVAAALVLGLAFMICRTGYGLTPALLFGGFFYLIVSGATFWGLLVCRAAIRLGNMSYGIYLMQGLVLRGMFSIPAIRHFALASPFAYWAAILVNGIVLITIAAFAHAAIERPGIEFGRQVMSARRVVWVEVSGRFLKKAPQKLF